MTGDVPHRVEEGTLEDGTAWRLRVPATWDGILVSDADLTDQPAHADVDRWYLGEGIAVVRTSREPAAWQVGRMIENRRRVHELVEGLLGAARTVVATGESLGGMVSRAVAERAPDLADAALAMNGGGSGLIGLWNAKEDAGFALRTLLGDAHDLPSVLERAEADPAGRARATLAAAFAMQPTWSDPDSPRPDADDLDAQAAVMRSALGFGLAPAIRADVERLAGGVFAGNDDVVYAELAGRLGRRRAVVEAAYDRAGLRLDDDLAALDAAPRRAADPAARAWAESGSWSGRLQRPLLAVYAIGDPAAVPEEQRAYRDAALRRGGAGALHERYLDAAGHCRFTTGERGAAFRGALRLARGEAVGSIDELQQEACTVDDAWAAGGRLRPERAAAFTDHEPDPYLRPHDLAGAVADREV